jgi:hypothetical protein
MPSSLTTDQIRKWTIRDLGRAFMAHTEQEGDWQAHFQEDLSELKLLYKDLHKILIVGNGEPSLREQVRAQSHWISSVNKVAWLVLSILLGQVIIFGCSLMLILFAFLAQQNLLP